MVAGGEPCPKCRLPMQRCEHGERWVPKAAQPYYFRYWDRCLECRHLQHYEAAKVRLDYVDRERLRGEPFDMDHWELI